MSTTTELQAWLSGTATGGPNGDGRYPLTDAGGNVKLVLCPAAQALNPTIDPSPIDLYVASAAADAAVANNAAIRAGEWANKAEDSAVTTGLFSAYHWAQKARAYSESPASVDLSNYYTKSQVDTSLSGKAASATTLSGYGITDAYTKSQVDTSLAGKANLSGATFTGTVVSGASSGDLRVGGQGAGNAATSFRFDGTMAAVASGTPGTYYSIWHSGNFNPAAKASLNASVNFVDVTASRGDGSGVIYLGNSGTRYLFWDNTNYNLPGAGLNVGGLVWSSGGGAGFHTNDRSNGSQFLAFYRNVGTGYIYDNVNSNMMSFNSTIHSMKSHYFDNGDNYMLAANAAAWVRVPRIFVTSGDPGAQAADGDLWFW